MDEALAELVEREQNLTGFRTWQYPRRLLIARRHCARTGTLQYVEAIHTGSAALRTELDCNLGTADGHVSNSSATNLDIVAFPGYSPSK